MRKIIFGLLLFVCHSGFSQTANPIRQGSDINPYTQTFGDIIPPTTVFDPNMVTLVGTATFDTTGQGGFAAIGGGSAGTFTNYILFKHAPTSLPEWYVEMKFKITSAVSGTNYGPRPGAKSINTNGVYDVMGVLTTQASPALQSIYNSSGTSLYGSLPSAFTISQNDIVDFVGHFKDSTFTGTWTNLTTSTAATPLSYSFTDSGATNFLPNIVQFAIAEAGGTQQLQYLHAWSPCPVMPNFLGWGASIMQGYNSKYFYNSFGRALVRQYGGMVYAGGRNSLIEMKKQIPELQKALPVQVLGSDWGMNDLLNGRSLTAIYADIDTCAAFLNSIGANWALIETPNDSTAGGDNHVTDVKNYIAANYPTHYIDVWTSMSTSNVLKSIYSSPGGIHPNSAGHAQVYSVVSTANFFNLASSKTTTQLRTDGSISIGQNYLSSKYKTTFSPSHILVADPTTANTVSVSDIQNDLLGHASVNMQIDKSFGWIVNGQMATVGSGSGFLWGDRGSTRRNWGIYGSGSTLVLVHVADGINYLTWDSLNTGPLILEAITGTIHAIGSTNTGHAALQVRSTTLPQSELSYDATHYATDQVDASGNRITSITGGGWSANSDFKLSTVGKGLYVKEGSNATMGTATLSGGTVTISTTKVTASSRIHITIQSLGTVTTPKAVGVTARVAGTSFTITSADATDTSVIAWIIIEPS